MHSVSPSDKLKSGKQKTFFSQPNAELVFNDQSSQLNGNSFISSPTRFQNRRMKLKKEIQAIKELNEQEKQAQAQKAALVAQGHSIGDN